jgi:hypothetical protein
VIALGMAKPDVRDELTRLVWNMNPHRLHIYAIKIPVEFHILAVAMGVESQ